jgi:P22_AR N-terminal domain
MRNMSVCRKKSSVYAKTSAAAGSIGSTTVDFYGQTLVGAKVGGLNYVALKPFCKGMKLSWSGQSRKLRRSSRFHATRLPIETPFGVYQMICLPVIELEEWLRSINPEKVNAMTQWHLMLYRDNLSEILDKLFETQKETTKESINKGVNAMKLVQFPKQAANTSDPGTQAKKVYEPTEVMFHGHKLQAVDIEGEIYVVMKNVVEGMGLSCSRQYQKIKSNPRFDAHMGIDIQTPAGPRESLCMPLLKMHGWLFTINPEKVAPHLRNDVILFQEECYSVLFNYFTKGAAVNSRIFKNQEKLQSFLEQEASTKPQSFSRSATRHPGEKGL